MYKYVYIYTYTHTHTYIYTTYEYKHAIHMCMVGSFLWGMRRKTIAKLQENTVLFLLFFR